jgi:hypothetical protein
MVLNFRCLNSINPRVLCINSVVLKLHNRILLWKENISIYSMLPELYDFRLISLCFFGVSVFVPLLTLSIAFLLPLCLTKLLLNVFFLFFLKFLISVCLVAYVLRLLLPEIVLSLILELSLVFLLVIFITSKDTSCLIYRQLILFSFLVTMFSINLFFLIILLSPLLILIFIFISMIVVVLLASYHLLAKTSTGKPSGALLLVIPQWCGDLDQMTSALCRLRQAKGHLLTIWHLVFVVSFSLADHEVLCASKKHCAISIVNEIGLAITFNWGAGAKETGD